MRFTHPGFRQRICALGLSLLALLLALIAPVLRAQTAPILPDKPTDPTAASITGFITDQDNDSIPNATLTLKIPPTTKLTGVTNSEGRFTFGMLPGGAATLIVSAKGFGTITREVLLQPGDRLDLPNIALPVSADIDVEVSNMSQEEIAEEQIHLEEHQYVLGAIPNFFVTYDWNAAPLNKRQKFQLAYKSILSPSTFVFNGVVAGLEQAGDAFPGYNQGAMGYAKRYGAGMADLTVGTLVGGFLFPALLHQDPRYFYMGKGTITHRALYALSSAIITRGDNGKWQPNYSSVAGDIASGAVSNLYYPASDTSGAVLTIENGLLAAASDGVGNLIQEFLIPHLTPHRVKHPTTDH